MTVHCLKEAWKTWNDTRRRTHQSPHRLEFCTGRIEGTNLRLQPWDITACSSKEENISSKIHFELKNEMMMMQLIMKRAGWLFVWFVLFWSYLKLIYVFVGDCIELNLISNDFRNTSKIGNLYEKRKFFLQWHESSSQTKMNPNELVYPKKIDRRSLQKSDCIQFSDYIMVYSFHHSGSPEFWNR